MKKLFLALVLGVAGCAAAPPIYVDSRFTADEVVQIQEAADEWARATGGTAEPIDLVFNQHVESSEVADGHHRRVMIRALSTDPEVNETFDNHQTIGDDYSVHWFFGESSERLVIVADRAAQAGTSIKTIAMHEFGHHLGLHHVGPKTAIMYPRSQAACVTHADLDEFCGANGPCNRHDMHPCDDP